MNGSTNGHISNGSINGHTNGSTNGHINGTESIMNGTNGYLETGGHLKGKANVHMNGGTKGHINNGHAMNGSTNGHINGTLPNGNTGKNINLIIWLTSIFRSLIQTLMAPSENTLLLLTFYSEFQQTCEGH